MALSPAACDAIRAKILAAPLGRNPEACQWLMERVLGARVPWYVRIWVRWILAYPRTVLLAKRGLGKSFVKSCIDLYRILCDFNTRALTISKTDTAAAALNGPVRAALETNVVLKQAFGEFVGRARWQDGAITIAQRTDLMIPEGTLEARGIEGQIARTHWSHIGIDDGQDEDRARSELLTERDWGWLFTTVRGALLPRGTIHINATPYSHLDLVTRIEDWIDQRTGEVRAEAFHIEDVSHGFPEPSARWMILRTPARMRSGDSIDPELIPLEDHVDPETGEVVEGLLSLEGTPGYETQQLVEKPRKPDTTARETIFRREWLTPWTEAPARADLRVVQFIDPAWLSAMIRRSRHFKDPDWFVVSTMAWHRHERRVYVMDSVRARVPLHERFRLAATEADRWDPEVIGVERTNLQDSSRFPGAKEFYEGIRRLLGARVKFVSPREDKVARAEPFALACQKDRVRWNPSLLARPDLTDPERGELMVFPFGEDVKPEAVHDDQVDGFSGAFALVRVRSTNLGAFAAQGIAGSSAVARYSPPSASDAGARGAAPRAGLADASRWVVPR